MASYDDILRDPLFLVVFAVILTVLFAGLVVHWTKKKERLKEDIEKIYTPILKLLNCEIDGIEQRQNQNMTRPSYLLRFNLPDYIEYRLLPKDFKKFRKDLSELVTLSEEANSRDCDLDKITTNELETRVDKMRNDTSLSRRLDSTLFQKFQNDLLSPLRKNSIDDVERLVKDTQDNDAITGDKDLFGEKARELFQSIAPKAEKAREAYKEADRNYAEHVRSVHSRLKKRLAKRRRY